MRVILVAEHASIDFGGEGALPCHYFRVLLSRNIDVYLVVHNRSRAFIEKAFPDSRDRVHYVPDSRLHKFFYAASSVPMLGLTKIIFGVLLRMLTQMYQKKIVKALVRGRKDVVVHQVAPVSPKEPSLFSGMKAPLVIGPLNGGMYYPKNLKYLETRLSRYFTEFARNTSELIHRIFTGKKYAQVIMVANQRTQDALPACCCGKVIQLVENGVDLSVWKRSSQSVSEKDCPVFVYVGRLVGWKAVDILLDAFFKACRQYGEMHLHIFGDGEKREILQGIVAANRSNPGKVFFEGWVSQPKIAAFLPQADALALPSLYECGGATVLEAMACSIPVIATAWGGPADYLDDSCGILIEPSSRRDMVDDFAKALLKLAGQPKLARRMGRNGRKKVEEEYDWQKKVDAVISIYQKEIAIFDFTAEKIISGRASIQRTTYKRL